MLGFAPRAYALHLGGSQGGFELFHAMGMAKEGIHEKDMES
jgi:hypothetical protein